MSVIQRSSIAVSSFLSSGRSCLAAGAGGNKIVFAGGSDMQHSKVADIFDLNANSRSVFQLSDAHHFGTVGAALNKITVAGGSASAAAVTES